MKAKIEKSNVLEIFELSSIQKGILFHYLRDSGSHIYNVQLVFDIRGSLDKDRLDRAVAAVQRQNPVLRSVFSWEKVSKPLQILLKTYPRPFEYIDISGIGTQERQASLQRCLEEDRQERFDLETLALRLKLIKTSPDTFVFSITHHHILYDGWSTGLLLTELFLAYRHPDREPIKPDYPGIYRRHAGRNLPEDGRRYWRAYLEDYQMHSLLPPIRDRNHTVNSFRVGRPMAALDRFSAQHRVTKAALIYAAFGLLLQKYANSSDVVFGTPVADRDPAIPGIERLIGNFINTLPLRVTATDEATLLDIVLRVHADMADRHEHSHHSYAEIKDVLKLRPDENLFEITVAVENYPLDKTAIEGIEGLSVTLRSSYEFTDSPIAVNVFFGADLGVSIAYDLAFADEAFARQLAEHFLAILDKICDDPFCLVHRLDILSDAERRLLLETFNDTAAEFPETETIVSLFEKQVSRTPDNTAICCDGKIFSYRTVYEEMNRIAAGLTTTYALGAGDVAGVLMMKSERLLITILAILKTGASYLPIDLSNPPDRVAYMVEDSDMKLLITDQPSVSAITPSGLSVLGYETLQAAAGWSGNMTGAPCWPDYLAYTIYTSGSTGMPKGVGLKHRGFVNLIYWYAKALAGTETDNYLLIAPVSFDLAQKNIFTPLLTGASITLSEDIQLDYGRMAATIASKGVTVINCAPSAWYPLLEEAAHNGYRDLAGVRKVVLGGENIHMKAFEGWFHSGNFHAQLINSYGPTECTDVVAWHQLEDPVHRAYDRVPIGRPVDNMRLYILDRQGALQPLGALGEICIGGTGVSDGYRNNPELTRRKFFPDAISGKGMLYRTGDAGRWLRNGEMEFIGRIDNQVKIRGFRVEPGEIEVQLSRHERVRQCAVIVGEKEAEKFLVAYYVADHPLESAALRAFLSARLPHYMVPAWYVHLTSLPRTPNGKLDRRALPSPQIRAESEQTVPTRAMEKKLLAIWCDVLGQTRIGVTDNFFDVGGDSLKLITVSSRIRVDMEKQVPVTELLQYPTIRTLADHLQPAVQKNREQSNAEPSAAAKDIAIIGMACRFPGAPDVDAFWGNLRAGRESITREGDADISGEYRLVRAKGLLEGYECFDAAFFNYSPADAKLMDPQIRIFHETVWEALEHAGYRCPSFPGRIGLYAGATPSPYYELDTSKPQGDQLLEEWASLSYADKDFLCARVSYKLNLRGPSLNINTACSTSLVATDLACQELMAGKCEMAVAGGISVTLHDNEGYIYHKGMVMSPDGRCRAFDAEAAGTVGGNGSGAVVLRRLEDALRDGDTIYAVIKGTATNNDGNRKVGFTAPGVDGQAAVISHAMRKAGVRPEDIGYVEAHGSGTLLGDPIEVAALVEAFGTDKRAYCGLGSVKTNIGHLDAAAGIAGLIKTVLALYHGEIPPSLHFHQPNPNLELGASPFYINDRLRDWQKDGRPRTAGVSSFGIGGTNAHIILQEAPPRSAGSASRSHQLLLLSARSENALAANSARLADHLQAMADEEHSGRTAEQQALADLAYTLQTGREPMPYRRMIVCDTVVQAIEQLSIFPVNGKTSPLDESLANRVVFLFPGQGAQYSGMCRGLYEKEPYFREQMDSCLAIVRQLSGKDLKPLIFGGSRRLHDTETAQPALFVVEYALARLLMKWGILPHLMIGHSFGEYVAACLSGVFSLEDALSIVVKRGELMQQAPGGISLGVAVSEEVLTSWLEKYPGVSLATVNSSELCVVSGQAEQIEAFRKEMVICGYPSEVVSEAHAFHSSRMDGILEAFASHIRQIHPATPRIPFVSNLTGEVATADAVTGTAYWVDHLRKTVRFADGIRTLMKEEHMVFVEVGPGIELSSFVRSMRERGPGHKVINMVRHAQTEGDDQYHLEKGIGRLWLIGIEPAWGSFYEGETRRRVPLPSYAFDRVCFPVRNKRPVAGTAKTEEDLVRSKDISRWWYAPTWRHVPLLPEPAGSDGSCTLLLDDDLWIGAGVAEVLRGYGERVILVRKAAAYKNDGDLYHVNPSNSQDFYRLWEDLGTRRITPHRIIHGWALHRRKDPSFHPAEFSDICATYLFSVLHLVKAARQHDRLSIREIVVLTNDLYNITGYEDAAPAKSISLGLLKVISQEYPVISTLHIDLSLQGRAVQPTTEALLAEIFRKGTGRTVALRGARRWLQEYVAVPFFARNVVEKPLFRHRGVYLITGGLGSLGFVWSRFLQRKYQATIILVGRSSLEEIDATPEVQSKLRMLRLLQQEEGAVSYYSCDVSDLSGMRQLVCEVEERFGRIDGVVHAAGMVKGRSIAPIATLEEGDFSAQFLPKITGLMVLQEALAGREIGCRLVISSLSPILGGLEFGAYASANSYMDHLVQAMSADPKTRWTCLNIDGLNLKGGQGEGIRADELETVLEMLPAYMGLSQIVVSVADLNRRLDQWIRREADPVEEPDISGAVEGAAPEGSVTDRLIQLWKKFFGVTHIGPEDDFLELGGDSLKALTMVGRIYREFNVELPVKDLFNHSTIRNLSARIADQGKPADTKTYHSIPIAAAMESYSLSSVQRRLYFLYEFDKSSTAYNQALTLKLNGRVDGDKIGEVFRQLIRRHESLRTSFGMVGEEPRQQVAEDWLFNVEVLKADGDEDKLIRDFIRPFNLGKAPLIRAGLIEVAAEQYILVVDMHHIITDAVSKGVLMKDFMALYAGEQLPAPRLQYKDFVQWQREDRQQEEMKRKKAFWFREFSEVLPPMELPADHPRPSVKTYDGDAYSFELDASLTTSLTALAEKEGSTLFMVLLTAYTVLLSRLAMQDDIVVGTYTAGRQHPDLESILGMFVNTLPLRFRVSRHLAFRELLAQVKTRVLQCFDNQSYPYEELIDDLKWERDASRNPLFEALFSYRNYEHTALELPGLRIGEYPRVKVVVNFDLTLTAIRQRDILSLEFEYATRLFNRDTIGRFAGFFKKIILALVDTPETAIGAIDILSGAQRQQLLFGFNQTQGVYPDTETIVSLFERQASKTPDAVAIVYEGKQLTFRELDETSRRLAVFLRERYGIAPGKTVAIMVQRSEWLLVGLLGILMAGGAYLPIDAGYPESRIAYILEDSGARVLLTDRGSGKPPAGQYENIDVEDAAIYAAHPLPLKRTHTPQDLCYLIYTSGSTGKPKGVMITHKNVVNFFSAMNERLGDTVSGCMLAVTSASFDISVLELLWTLCRGMQVVLHPSDISLTTLDRYVVEEKGTVDFSLFFFSSYHFDEQDKYRLLLESVRYADRHGFKAVWTPERHFHEFGGLYPNPSVVSAALAMVTSKIELRSGSIVAPLHDPLRIAEEWAVADNLSNGRIGLSFASGWNPADFVLATTDYKDRQDTLYSQLDEVKKLWKGETVLRRNGLDREVEVRVFPAPVQRELPVWITSGGSEESFIRAGAAGANLLTHLLGQDITELARKISLYRQALRENGHHENKAIVTLMLHAYIGESTAEVEQAVQAPFTEYLKSSIGLSRVFNEESGLKEEDIPEQEKERMIQNAFRRYYKTGSLIGTQTSCREMISRVRAAGVDEIACLIDFGVDPQKVLEGLERLREVKDLVNSASRRHAPVTMLQSTPSFIRLSLESPGSQQLLSSLQYLLLGGEPVPLSLVQRLRKEAPDTRIFNMYGPTETTIWSCAGELMKDADKITIGTPILNTQIYILDNDLQLLPIGVAGEVYIGGEGLSQGYWERPELTAERFIANPFVKGGCIYRTGDIGRWLPDGTIELQGRRDQQVKVRGYRIELGEIEQVLCAYAHVKEAVVAARDGKDGEKYLAAYVVAEGLQDLSGLREYVSLHLPQYMVPGHFVRLENLPLTPNGKIDRKALPDPEIGPAYADVAPSNETEKKLAALWSEILKLDEKVIGVRSSFFEMGGHSLNALVLIRRIARDFQVEILLQKIFVLQTIERIADVIDNTRWVLGQTREEVTRGEEVILE